MNWSKHHRDGGRDKGRGRRRGYHHGNLREALIEAALDLIADKGPAGFTFAEGPAWGADGCLYFTDIPNDVIYRVTDNGELTDFLRPSEEANFELGSTIE